MAEGQEIPPTLAELRRLIESETRAAREKLEALARENVELRAKVEALLKEREEKASQEIRRLEQKPLYWW
jgi:ElaB/YqjD/DUF883 family membrane-anchored ribosome-binding protein